jgi:hypothetical protein
MRLEPSKILQMTSDGSRLLAATFQAGQVVMLDTTDRSHLKQVSLVNLGPGSGPHNIRLTHDDRRGDDCQDSIFPTPEKSPLKKSH